MFHFKRKDAYEKCLLTKYLRLWKLKAECIFMPSWMNSVEAFFGIIII